MKRLITNLPRNVLIATAGIMFMVGVLAVLYPLLGGARDQAVSDNARLTSELQVTEMGIIRAKEDHQFVVEHQGEYEKLLSGDKLLPHSRRTAVAELQRVAGIRQLTSLNYNFAAAAATSVQAVASQPTSGTYKISVEQIDLKVGAPYDGAIYGFLADVTQTFPGTIVVESFAFSRAPTVSNEALNAVSKGEDARLVSGEVTLSWRTAQANEKAAEPEK